MSPAAAEWLGRDAAPGEVFTPEMLTDDHRLIGRTASDFLAREVIPATDELEQKNWGVSRALLRRCGELGLLGVDVPDDFGGVALDKISAVLVTEALGPAASFSTTFGAQANLSIVPILWFGTDAQRRAYLPRLVSGEIVGAYALSESGSGSDALAARTRATRQPDGSWQLTGEKLWITNGGFADLFVVFAKVDGAAFSAFLVERSFPGVSSGGEERKMGLHGSSTTALILQDAIVPADGLLGEAGQAHKIAFNVLNYGRVKLAAMCSGCAKAAIGEAARYAAARRQFGRPIARFRAIGQKLAEMTVREYAVESMLYRTAGAIEGAMAGGARASAAVFEDFAVEASLLKVAGSEMLDFVLDENVQIHGGYGFVHDYPAERRYRDARVNRIFEGTNEINRLLAPTLLLKRSRTGRIAPLDLGSGEGASAPAKDDRREDDGLRAVTWSRVRGLKKTALTLLGLAARTYGETLHEEQEILMLTSDILRDAFAAESALLRAETSGFGPLHRDAAAVIAFDAATRAGAGVRIALAGMASGDTLKSTAAALERMFPAAALNTIAARRRIGEAVAARDGYIFD